MIESFLKGPDDVIDRIERPPVAFLHVIRRFEESGLQILGIDSDEAAEIQEPRNGSFDEREHEIFDARLLLLLAGGDLDAIHDGVLELLRHSFILPLPLVIADPELPLAQDLDHDLLIDSEAVEDIPYISVLRPYDLQENILAHDLLEPVRFHLILGFYESPFVIIGKTVEHAFALVYKTWIL